MRPPRPNYIYGFYGAAIAVASGIFALSGDNPHFYHWFVVALIGFFWSLVLFLKHERGDDPPLLVLFA